MGYVGKRVHKADIAHYNDKMDTRGCIGCVAREKEGTCKFMGIFGVSRNVLDAPTYPGGGCRLKRDKNGNHLDVTPKSWINSSHKPKVADWDDEKALALYQQGLYDQEIADQIGVSKPTVCRWRNGMGLPPNKSRRRKDGTMVDWDLAEKLYAEGKNDVEIAKELGDNIPNYAVRDWRLRTNKPANQPRSKVW